MCPWARRLTSLSPHLLTYDIPPTSCDGFKGSSREAAGCLAPSRCLTVAATGESTRGGAASSVGKRGEGDTYEVPRACRTPILIGAVADQWLNPHSPLAMGQGWGNQDAFVGQVGAAWRRCARGRQRAGAKPQPRVGTGMGYFTDEETEAQGAQATCRGRQVASGSPSPRHCCTQ